MPSMSSSVMLILLLSLGALGLIFSIAWKTDKFRWLLWLLPVLLVGAIFSLAYSQDHDFWRSTHALYQGAQESAREATRLAPWNWPGRPGPGNRIILSMGFFWAGFTSMPVSSKLRWRFPGR